MSAEATDARRRLRGLKRRRKTHVKRGEALASEIKEALGEARLAGIPMEEAAELLGLNRTTLYQVYLDVKPESAAA